MKQLSRALAFVLALLPVAVAAQQFPTVPDHTVIGRAGTGTSSGPSQAIPWSVLLANLSGAVNANTVYAGPSSGVAQVPTFRALVGADLPAPGASSLGGVQSMTCSSHNWFNALSTAGVLGCTQPAFSDISGSVAATQLPNPSATTLGGVKSLAAVSHNFLTSISTAGAPTQAQPACTDLSDATSCNAARGQLPGETGTGSATAGNVGEYIESVIASGSAVSLTNNTAKTVTSITLSAGDWDVSGNVSFVQAASTSVTGVFASLSGTTNVSDLTPGKYSGSFFGAGVPGAGTSYAVPVGPYRISASGSTTVFLIAVSNFTVSTNSGYGIIRARRVR